jgi:hypothetical protein
LSARAETRLRPQRKSNSFSPLLHFVQKSFRVVDLSIPDKKIDNLANRFGLGAGAQLKRDLSGID